MQNTKVIVIGGGMVGALTALLLAKQGKSICLVEKTPCVPIDENAPFDLRVSAFSAQSIKLLESADIWDLLPIQRLCAYKGLQTWEKGSQKLTFDAQDIGFDQLGYIAENRCIQSALWQKLRGYDNVDFYENRSVIDIEHLSTGVAITLDNNQKLQADILIACDGANSDIRKHLDIGVTAWDYRHYCMLINIKTDTVQQSVTWQEFRETGPCAFLPLAGNNASLVWYHSPEKIRQLSGLSNAQLKQTIVDQFPRLDFDFSVENKGAFPLTRSHAHDYFKGSCVLLGDAAHTINPLAGQGVNLGFKDVECLVNLMEDSNLSMSLVLNKYQSKRKPANLLMQTGMDLFYKSSKSEMPVLRLLRKGVLGITQNSGPLKKQVMRYAMGL
jgi:2-octaprenyl-3-methyl-6-methoxy-1,4-benzoquinol hydroxylase